MILAAQARRSDWTVGQWRALINAKLDEEFFAAAKVEACEQEFFPEDT